MALPHSRARGRSSLETGTALNPVRARAPVQGQSAAEDGGGAPGLAPAPYNLPYLEAFMTVLHMLITLIIAPMSGPGTSAETWIIPKMLSILDTRAPQHQRIQVRAPHGHPGRVSLHAHVAGSCCLPLFLCCC